MSKTKYLTQPEHAVFGTRWQNLALYNASLINVCRKLRLTRQIHFSAKITEISHKNELIVTCYRGEFAQVLSIKDRLFLHRYNRRL